MKKRLVTVLCTMALTLTMGMTAFAKDVSDYTDVHEGDWFYNPVADVSEKGLMTGTSETTFAPGKNLERGQLASVLYRMQGNPETSYGYRFPDVPDGVFYSVPVTWAYDFGVISGYNDGTFGPSDKITREQLATMLYRYAQKTGYDTSVSGDTGNFSDGGRVSGFAKDAMNWAVGYGIISGEADGRLNPQGNVSRAVCATMISRLGEPEKQEPEHTHVWKEHTATKTEWVPNIVTVPDYEIQKVPVGTAWKCNCGAVITGYSGDHAMNHILNGEPDNGYTIIIYEDREVQVGSHTEDHGSNVTTTYVDYYYCDCGATKAADN